MNILDLDNPIKYPKELNPGEEFSTWFNIDEIAKNSLNKVKANKFRMIITDTHGKEYKSEWYGTKKFHLKN